MQGDIIDIHPKFQLLFTAYNDKNISYILLKGGRNAMKSHAISLFAFFYLQMEGNLIYSRYTKSAVSSTIYKDLEDIVFQSRDSRFEMTKNLVRYRKGKDKYNELIFKGLKANSNDADANNKGINAYKVAIVDEVQDMTNFDEFQRFNLSVRSADETTEAKMILAFNPSDVNHWIYKKFYKDKVEEGFNGILGSVAYIDVTYLDAIDLGVKVDKKVLEEAKELMEFDIDKYNNIFKGHWSKLSDKIIFDKATLKLYEDEPEEFEQILAYLDVADQGTDYLCLVVIGCKDGKAYVVDVVYTQANVTESIPLVVECVEKWNPYMLRVESNAMGHTYTSILRERIDTESVMIQGVTNSITKIVRIENASYKIKGKFLFRKNQNREYKKFFDDLTQVTRDGKNQIDDGADALAGAEKMFRTIYLTNYDTEN